ncbi:hypothetical protein [Stenotrophomonas maltophilia]|uniref:hypothetical protein n=1 Tax=Stenotrophomonas maltophilia TaxID=40324 RepID=UPI0015DEB9D3|nr:hypothetical protein [Stenotrophomonas maltophilia]
MSNEPPLLDRLKAAFDRLKSGQPEVLPPGALVSQNNVAREAGIPPAHFKKSRFGPLIAEVQAHVAQRDGALLSERAKSTSLELKLADAVARISELKSERDHLRSLLLSAEMKLAELARR